MGMFDIINLEQVLEHTQEPFDILTGVSAYLKPGGIVRITVPNLTRVQSSNLWEDFLLEGPECISCLHMNIFKGLSERP